MPVRAGEDVDHLAEQQHEGESVGALEAAFERVASTGRPTTMKATIARNETTDAAVVTSAIICRSAS